MLIHCNQKWTKFFSLWRGYNKCTQLCNIHLSRRNVASHSLRVLFYGTDLFSLESLKLLTTEVQGSSTSKVVKDLEVVCIKPSEKQPQVQQCAVRSFASDAGLKVHNWPYEIPHDRYDIGVIVSFGHLIPESVISAFPLGMLNVHPSLLPRWRGAAPIQHTILAGDTVTGITVMEIRPHRFDVGPMLLQRSVTVPPACTASQLSKLLAAKGAKMLLQCLHNIEHYMLYAEEQPTDGATLARKITSRLARVNFAEQTAEEVDRQYRAVSETVPLHCLWGEEPVKLYDMVTLNESSNFSDFAADNGISMCPGSCVHSRNLDAVLIRCRDNWVAFKMICLSGRKRMTAKEFQNGFLSKAKHKDKLFC